MLSVSFVFAGNGGFKLLFGCVVCCLLIGFGVGVMVGKFAVAVVWYWFWGLGHSCLRLIVLFSLLLCVGFVCGALY